MRLILLPGLDGHGPFFTSLEKRLPGVPVQSFIYPDAPMGYAQLEEWLLPQLDTSEPFVLLGESFGGPLAIRLAARGHTHLRGVILAVTFSVPPLPAWLIHLLKRQYSHLIHAPYAPSVINYFLFNGHDYAFAKEVTEVLRAQADETVLARIEAVAKANETQLLAALPCPVLMLIAGHDRIVLRNYPKEMLAASAARRAVRLNSSHALLHTQAEAAAGHISGFINAL